MLGFGYLCIFGFGRMRVCLDVGIIMLGGFFSSDHFVISWAMNIMCGVKW